MESLCTQYRPKRLHCSNGPRGLQYTPWCSIACRPNRATTRPALDHVHKTRHQRSPLLPIQPCVLPLTVYLHYSTMSSDVLIDLRDNSPSLASINSDDSDAVNTDAARVYFGPLQSPEKKFAAPGMRTPLRRSARLSSLPRDIEALRADDDNDNDDDEGFQSNLVGPESREGTPVQDDLQADGELWKSRYLEPTDLYRSRTVICAC